MAHEFIGCSVFITLISPPDEKLRGEVANIEDYKLYLKDGRLRMTGNPHLKASSTRS